MCKDTLGKGGYATVKLAVHSETGQECALKIMRRKPADEIVNQIYLDEVEMMKKMSHQNIIQILDFSDEAVYTLPNGRSMPVYYIALELASGGELFDFIAETGRFSEPVARYFFHQLVEGIEYMHKNGIIHRDIKPENIMLDANFDLKISDFGFASDETTSTLRKGTPSYMAPEMYIVDEFKTQPLDIFAMGIVLFIMIKAAPPFNMAKPNDPHYKLFCANNKMFWKVHFKKFKASPPSNEITELLTKMMDYNAERRITLEEIKASEWYNGPLPTREDISQEFATRKLQLDEMDVEMEE